MVRDFYFDEWVTTANVTCEQLIRAVNNVWNIRRYLKGRAVARHGKPQVVSVIRIARK